MTGHTYKICSDLSEDVPVLRMVVSVVGYVTDPPASVSAYSPAVERGIVVAGEVSILSLGGNLNGCRVKIKISR